MVRSVDEVCHEKVSMPHGTKCMANEPDIGIISEKRLRILNGNEVCCDVLYVVGRCTVKAVDRRVLLCCTLEFAKPNGGG
jgi:hypothetical protein